MEAVKRTPARIALLEDDLDQAALMVGWLERAGHKPAHFDNSKEFLRNVLRESYDLLMLDWLLPSMNGLEVLQRVRESGKNNTPVLFITAKDAEADIVEALEAGADDYMSKPLRSGEMLARVEALIRRAYGNRKAEQLPQTAPYVFDVKRKRVLLGDDEIELTHREFDLALFMFRHAGSVVSRSHILESIWGMHGAELNTRTVDTHISRLRKKLQINESTGWRLSAIYQHGYRLEKLDDEAAD